MKYYEQQAAMPQRGDTVKVVQATGHRVRASAVGQRGFTLIELIITMAVLAILTTGALPLVKIAVKRQKEQELREALRTMRAAIDEFHRDTAQMDRLCQGTASTTTGQQVTIPVDPRSRVIISDCTIFGVDNIDRYPPDLDTLVKGVNVIPRVQPATGGAGIGGNTGTATSQGAAASTKTKVYLRGIPVDPMTGEKDWDVRSCYDEADSTTTGGENVWDVHSKSKGAALNGEKYSDW
jgi:general secretion pathway protein G